MPIEIKKQEQLVLTLGAKGHLLTCRSVMKSIVKFLMPWRVTPGRVGDSRTGDECISAQLPHKRVP